MIHLRLATAVLDKGLDAGAFSAVTAEIGSSTGAVWTHAGGRLSFETGAAAVDTTETVFDLASLTKVLATTTIALILHARDGLDLETRVETLVPEWSAADRRDVTLRDLLEHSSGLPAYRTYFHDIRGRAGYTAAIAAEALEYAPRTRSLYSDLGFIVLGFALEAFARRTLDQQFDAWRAASQIRGPLQFLPPRDWLARTAATEHDPWRGRVLQGEVHDENAAALGGVAAHAGLFGTSPAVGEAARWWLQVLRGGDDAIAGVTAGLAQRFARRSAVPGSSRALGWDTMLPTSSCGTLMSRQAIGHTGFTGTSLWIDPERDLYFVLLTNRVHPTRNNDAIQQVRRAFHDAALTDLTPR